MSNFVKSVEKIQTTFTGTGGPNTINLTKGQDETKCVPFYTMRNTANGSDFRSQNFCRILMIDNSGTAAAQVRWSGGDAVVSGNITVDIFVVEFGDNVTVQAGTLSITGTSATDTITTVTQANSFIVFNQDSGVIDSSDDFADSFIQAKFNSNTQIAFERRGAGFPDWELAYYVVESDGTDFTTEYIEDSWTNAEQGPTNLTISSVTTSKAFLVCTYETSESSDDLRDAVCNMAITAATTLTWYRNHAATPSATGTIGVWVVKTSGTEFSVERFATDVDGQTTTTQSITEVDQSQAIIVSNQNVAGGAWAIDSSTVGGNVDDREHSIVFSSDTQVSIQRLQDTAIDGSNNNVRYEVVEFELEGAAANLFVSLVGPGGLVGDGGLVGAHGGLVG